MNGAKREGVLEVMIASEAMNRLSIRRRSSISPKKSGDSDTEERDDDCPLLRAHVRTTWVEQRRERESSDIS